MNPAIYAAIFVLLFVILPQQRRMAVKRVRNRRKRAGYMTNEMLKNLIGKKCTVCSQNSFGVTGVITNIEDNWLEITNDKGIAKYLNADYVTNIDIVAQKKKKNEEI